MARLESLLSGRLRVGIREGFGGKVSRVLNLPQYLKDRGKVCVAQTGRAAVAIYEMDVANHPPALPNRIRDVCFFDVHVEKIGEDLHVRASERLNKGKHLLHSIQEVRFVTVERFIKNSNAFFRRVFSQLF